MNFSELKRKLLAAAQSNLPSDTVPYAFEQRIMARLDKLTPINVWADWSRSLWRAAAPCVALTILLGMWTAFAPGGNASSTDLSQDFEDTVFAAATTDHDSTW